LSSLVTNDLVSWLNQKPEERRKRTVGFRDPYFAIIFPVSWEHAERIFSGKDIFCKYTGRTGYLGADTIVLFYASKSGRKLLGEGVVKSVEFLTLKEMVRKYKDRLFATEKELEKYRGARSLETRLLVVQLKQVEKYKEPIVTPKIVTMAGQTLTENQYRHLAE
jgi:hypothetical protein